MIIENIDYIYALPLAFIPLQKVFIIYDKINELKPNFLNQGVYNAITIFNTNEIIWQDKLDKGIVRRIEYKNKNGEIYNVEWEEINGMYELIYGDDDF